MKMNKFETQAQAKPHTEIISDLNLAAVSFTTVQTSKLPF